MGFSIDTWIAVAAAAGSLVAALFAYRSTRIANRSLAISESLAEARKPKLVPYLVEGLVRTSSDIAGRTYAFSVLISNRADTDNAVARIELELSYRRAAGSMGNILLQHGSGIAIDGASPFSLPVRVGAHDTVAGWAVFGFDEPFASQVDVEGYRVRFSDTHGLEVTLEPLVLREVVDAPTMETR